MKCDKCKFKVFRPTGFLFDTLKDKDDPFHYWYCLKNHWEYGPETESPLDNYFDDCKDFEEAK